MPNEEWSAETSEESLPSFPFSIKLSKGRWYCEKTIRALKGALLEPANKSVKQKCHKTRELKEKCTSRHRWGS